jgi:hypothetical protein
MEEVVERSNLNLAIAVGAKHPEAGAGFPLLGTTQFPWLKTT